VPAAGKERQLWSDNVSLLCNRQQTSTTPFPAARTQAKKDIVLLSRRAKHFDRRPGGRGRIVQLISVAKAMKERTGEQRGWCWRGRWPRHHCCVAISSPLYSLWNERAFLTWIQRQGRSPLATSIVRSCYSEGPTPLTGHVRHGPHLAANRAIKTHLPQQNDAYNKIINLPLVAYAYLYSIRSQIIRNYTNKSLRCHWQTRATQCYS